jgi:Predicted transcriptional regulators
MNSATSQGISDKVVPKGVLKRLLPDEIARSEDNPRRLFDPEPLKDLKDNIRVHGVLVPITVYQAKGQQKYRILDGERRHRCCVELQAEGVSLKIPANIVEPPDKLARLLYMFSIHHFREDWELMPVAFGLKLVIQELGERDPKKLAHLTGLSAPQVERCFVLLSYPERFQKLSLDPNPEQRIPSNFWIEAKPVLDLIQRELPEFYERETRDGLTQRLVDKYRAKSIKSVIHFRRILEAFENTEDQGERNEVRDVLKKYLEDVPAETRRLFDRFVVEGRKIQGAIQACDDFTRTLKRMKLVIFLSFDEAGSSSSTVLNLLRDVAHLENQKCAILDAHDLSKLAALTYRLGEGVLVYVDDFVGSGRQVSKNIKFVRPNLQGNFVEVVLTVCICEEAIDILADLDVRAASGMEHTKAVRPLHPESQIFSPAEKERLTCLCSMVAPPVGLGFRRMATMVILYRNTPNNCPMVFRGSNGQCPYFGILPRTTDLAVPSDLRF